MMRAQKEVGRGLLTSNLLYGAIQWQTASGLSPLASPALKRMFARPFLVFGNHCNSRSQSICVFAVDEGTEIGIELLEMIRNPLRNSVIIEIFEGRIL